MGACCSRVPWDSLLSYSVVRTVKIRDWRLGLLQYIAMLAIGLYILVGNVALSQLYCARALTVLGSVRLSSMSPAQVYNVPPEQTPYCKGGSGNVSGSAISTYPCVYYDGYDAVYPETADTSIFVSTRISTLSQSLSPPGCQQNGTSACNYKGSKVPSYVGGPIELSTIRFDHSMYAGARGASLPNGSATKWAGTLYGVDKNGNEFEVDPCAGYEPWQKWKSATNSNAEVSTITANFSCDTKVVMFGQIGASGPNGSILYDTVPITTLLVAAGVYDSVDWLDKSAPSKNPLESTYRYDGLILIVNIVYSNLYLDKCKQFGGCGGIGGKLPANTGSSSLLHYNWDLSKVAYQMRVSTSTDTEFKAEQVLSGPGATDGTRTILDRHGIKIIVQQSGRIGYIDFATLLTALTASLGLLAVSGTVVLYIATMILPQRHLYSQYITATTAVTYSDLRGLPPSDLTRFRSDDVVNPAPESITKLASKARVVAARGKGGSAAASAEDAAADERTENLLGSRLLGPVTARASGGLAATYARVKSSDSLNIPGPRSGGGGYGT